MSVVGEVSVVGGGAVEVEAEELAGGATVLPAATGAALGTAAVVAAGRRAGGFAAAAGRRGAGRRQRAAARDRARRVDRAWRTVHLLRVRDTVVPFAVTRASALTVLNMAPSRPTMHAAVASQGRVRRYG